MGAVIIVMSQCNNNGRTWMCTVMVSIQRESRPKHNFTVMNVQDALFFRYTLLFVLFPNIYLVFLCTDWGKHSTLVFTSGFTIFNQINCHHTMNPGDGWEKKSQSHVGYGRYENPTLGPGVEMVSGPQI